MRLLSIDFSEYPEQQSYWNLIDFQLSNLNLMVGKNSSGKSRTINVINSLSNLLFTGKCIYNDGRFDVTFENEDKIYKYHLKYQSKLVIREELYINDKQYVLRNLDGGGAMFNELVDDQLSFKIPMDTLSVFKKDSIQYSYLEPLLTWAENVRLFSFNTNLGQRHLNAVKNPVVESNFNLRDTNRPIDVFIQGKLKFGEKYEQALIHDFNFIGYKIEDIGKVIPDNVEFNLEDINTQQIEEIYVLFVKEVDRRSITDQIKMSTGMFRALAILIHLNYYQFSESVGTLLIDDIGEGLDFERSTALIDLIINKAKALDLQVVMSTNDRFIMNNTPLEYWQVIDRRSSDVNLYNIRNSEKTFKEFQYTGLNNFEFFSTDFFREGFSASNNE